MARKNPTFEKEARKAPKTPKEKEKELVADIVDQRTKEDELPDSDERLLAMLGGDPVKVKAVMQRARAGTSWWKIAADIGIERTTMFEWLREWPLEKLARDLIFERCEGAILKLAIKIPNSVNVIGDHVDGRLSGDEHVDKMQIGAAKVALGLVMKIMEARDEDNAVSSGAPRSALFAGGVSGGSRTIGGQYVSPVHQLPTKKLVEMAAEIRRQTKAQR